MPSKQPIRAQDIDEVPAAPRDAYANPVDRFAQLPEHVRSFLEELSREDVATILAVVKAAERFAAIGWFFKMVILSSAGAFVALFGFGKSFREFWEWITK